jgi:putative CRISPR-associated protein (TIGR02619 family)
MADAAPEAAQRQSAELNGVVRLGLSNADTHYLLGTDTFQGRETIRLVADWLTRQGCRTIPYTVEHLSAADRESFAAGVDNLLIWCDAVLPPAREAGQRVVFNLVGGFKALQAYMQTLGMFYADEIVYIFETGNELIRIPRLPVQWDTAALGTYAAVVARLAHGDHDVVEGEVAEMPEAYLEIVEADGRTLVGLSTWGKAAWAVERRRILAGDLLPQPHIVYEHRFRRDYEGIRDTTVRAEIQDNVARVSVLLRRGGPAELRRDGALQYGPLKGHAGITHFRVSQNLRITCSVQGADLVLRRCGEHDVIDNP